ncbi:archaemetzincin-2-like [Oculina patagonica]
MSLSASKTTNTRVLLGKLKRFDKGIRHLFELAPLPADSCQNLYETFTGDPLDRREIQTYPAWKVQTCFRNLNRHQRKRSKQRKIYILPIGPFPEVLWKPVEGMEVSIFELLVNFAAVFFHGMIVKLMDEILVTEVNCKRRMHPETGKLQLLVTDLLHFLKTCLPYDGYCIIGVTWVDLYPGEEWNFVLGESSCEDGCAVMSFGHFEPQSYENKQLNDTLGNSNESDLLALSKGVHDQFGKNSTAFSSKPEKENGQGDINFYLEHFADVQKVDKQMIWRLLRVTSHEICHVFGMSHCSYFACAMNESKSIHQAEIQPLFLCPVCLRKLQKSLGFDIIDRYKALSSFLNSLIHNKTVFQNACCQSGEQGTLESFKCKFELSIQWLKSILLFIENKSTS